MKTLPDGADGMLAPLRERLAADAAAQAESIRAAAAADADAQLAAAGSEADRIRAEAEQGGMAEAEAAARSRYARVRRQAHSRVLAAADDVRRHLRAEVMAAASMVGSDPRYPALRALLIERGRRLLGPDATVEDVADGGVVLTSGSRPLDFSLQALADRALAEQAGELEELWRL